LGNDDGGSADATTDQQAGDDGGIDGPSDSASDSPSGQDSQDGETSEANVCTPGAACSPGECQTGVLACDAGATTCSSRGNALNGSTCEAGVCDNGSCVPCSVGADCAEAGSCQVVTIACASGRPVCTPGGNANNGTPCGLNLFGSDTTSVLEPA
jgi:hypothetical protein